jgi:hypothetical protein
MKTRLRNSRTHLINIQPQYKSAASGAKPLKFRRCGSHTDSSALLDTLY